MGLKLIGITARRKKTSIVLRNLMAGNAMSKACSEANVGMTTFYRWRQKSNRLNNLVINILESRIQMVEDSLFNTAMRGNFAAIRFFLLNRGMGRWKDDPQFQIINNSETHVTNIAITREALDLEIEERKRRIEELRKYAFSKVEPQ